MEEDLKEKDKKKKLGLFSCITILVGGMFGSAIFSLSGQTIVYSGPSALISWLIAGFILLFYGLIVAELSIIYPKTGGVYLFPAKTIGKKEITKKIIGWISSWGYLNSCLVGIIFAAIYVGTY
jgi:amino acid transporter